MRLVVLFSLIFFMVSLLGEDWPRWRGPRGDGTWFGPEIAKELPDNGLERVWKSTLYPGFSGVTVKGNRVYTMDRPPVEEFGETERVVCLNALNGNVLWDFRYPSEYGNLSYGKGPRASLTIHEEKVFGFGAMGHAFCLNAKDGKKVWFRNLSSEENASRPIWGFSGAPEVFGGEVLMHVGARPAGSILALDLDSGQTKWKAGSDKKAGYAPPLPILRDGRRELICWGPNRIMGLPIGGGKELWQVPYEVKYGVSITKPIYHDGIALVCGYWDGAMAIRLGDAPGDAKLLWKDEERLCGLMSQSLYREGLCYLLDRRNGLTCFELKTGRILWTDGHRLTTAGRNPQASLVWVGKGGDALSLNAEGELVFLNLSKDGYREHWRDQLVGKTWAHPAYAGSRVYARSDRELACFQLPLEK
jgi:outer membrane protein assembly factor BamB